MISIIIASVNKELLSNVSENIKKTIGVDFEIISFENTLEKRGLCEIYNLGARKAKYDMLCFMHEDIEFETINWGKKVIEIFSLYKPGLLGIAGSTYRSLLPSGWGPPGEFGTKPWRLNIIQGFKYKNRESVHEYYNIYHETVSKVACVDGVWLCTTKKIALDYGFDEKLLKGFHGYDIDFSLNVNQDYDVLVTFDILISHASEGNFDSNWLKEMIKVQEKWKECLPVNYEKYSAAELTVFEHSAFKRFMKETIKNKDFNFNEIQSLLLFYYKQRKINFFKLLKLYYKILIR